MSYMKSYLRFLSRNKLYTAIEVVGLSVSMAFVIIMSCFVWQNFSVNHHYPDQDRMYAIGSEGSLMSNVLMAKTMADAIPEIESTATLTFRNYSSVQIDDVVMNRRQYMSINKDFFEMFPTRFLHGNEETFNDINNILVTESLADRFGGEQIIGKKLLFDGGEEYEFTIAGIIDDFSDTIFSNVEIIVNQEHPSQKWHKTQQFGVISSGILSIVRVKEGTDEGDILHKMNIVYETELNIPESRRRENYLSLTRLDKIYTADTNEGYDGLKKGNAKLMTAFSIIVIFLLISAIFNYINLSTAISGKRTKETATRMLLGEGKRKVFIRHILESLAFMAVCMVAAFLIAYFCLPYVNRLIDSPIPIQLKFSQSYLLMYVLILGLTVLLCGVIPALTSFRFNAIDVIKGQYRYESKKTFSKVFIIIQNTIAIIIIAITLTMNAQIRHMITMPLNTNSEGIYICRTYSAEFEKTLRELPYVEKIGRAQGRPGRGYGTYGFELDEEGKTEVVMDFCECDSAAFEIFGFKVVKDYGIPGGNGAWLSESAVKILGIDPENPVFPKKNRWAINYSDIAGIIEDVPLNPALNMEEGAVSVILQCPQNAMTEYVAKLSSTTEDYIRELDRLCDEEVKRVLGPDAPVKSGYMPELIESSYEAVMKQTTMVTLFMVIAIMLSALGQIAMSAYYATQKEKDICIRKVFGGTVNSESIRNIIEYMIYCLIASVIAVPLSVWIAGQYLETFIYRMQQQTWIYVAAALSVFIISLGSVLWQTLRAARTNPAEALKKE